jgi:two-component system invasion response regulator UvrY
MTRILVVDDHPLVRKGIIQVIADELRGGTIGEASTAAEALAAVWSQCWDLVLLDISLPGRSGLDVLKEIKAARPKLPVLVLSGFPESQFAIRVFRVGAAGYLTKESPPETLLKAVRECLSGGKYITPGVADALALQLAADSSKPVHELLSDREYDVMLRIAAGEGVSHVATVLNLSVKTVSTYRSRILLKMGMENNAQLSQYAIRNNLIT